MASTQQCVASLARLSLAPTSRPLAASIPRFLAPSFVQQQAGFASLKPSKKPVKEYKSFRVYRKDPLETFSLCDAIRYIRAAEVGRPAASIKYELAVKLVTPKRSPIVRNSIRLPHPIRADVRIAVVCKEGSITAAEARMAGAVAVGEDSLFQQIKDGEFDFNRLICHTDSLPALTRANVGRILGPKGLMPSAKTNTVTKDIKGMLKDLIGSEKYREREGVVQIPVGQLSFTPEMLAANVKTVIGSIKKDIQALQAQHVVKDIDEIVLSSTNGPGLSLSGGFTSVDEKITPAHLSGVM